MTTISTIVRRALLTAGAVTALSAPVVAQNYEGPHQVRVGAFLQGGSTTLDSTFTPGPALLPPVPPPASGSGHLANNGGGITAGLEWVRDRWAFGFEGDFGLTNGSAAIVGAKIATDYFANLRGRVGFFARPDWFIYGTGGIGFRGVTVTEPPALGADSNGKTLTGAVFGGGTEFHRGNSIFFAEYLHNHYGSGNLGSLATGDVYGIKGNSDAFRLGVKFKVGFDGYYDEVRDGLRK